MKYELVCPANLLEGSGQWICVSGWTPPEIVLRRRDFRLVGPLYSSRGIDPLVRNLLANDWARNIVLLDDTKEDSISESMRDFRKFLAGDDSFVDEDIPREILKKLRSELQVREWQDELPGPVDGTFLGRFPKPELESPGVDEALVGLTIRRRTVEETWRAAVRTIRAVGFETKNSDGVEWQEILGLTLVVDEPSTEWHEDFPFTREFHNEYLNSFFEVRAGHSYSYGSRLNWEFDPTSTRNWIPIWRPEDGGLSTPPCLVGVWLRCEGRRLHCWGVFRSNEVFSAWPANVGGLIRFQEKLCRTSGLDMGKLFTTGGSSHIRNDNWVAADGVAPQRQWDSIGNFIVSAGRVEHESGWYVEGTARKIMRAIAARFPSLSVDHALYLGREIERTRNGHQQDH